MRGETLSTAESCTGGLIAQSITSVQLAAHAPILGGAIVYANEMKTEFADVPPKLIDELGAVSRPVAAALAEGIRERSGSTLGLGITGIAGPGGGTPTPPWAWSTSHSPTAARPSSRNAASPATAIASAGWPAMLALDMVRRRLM